MRLDASNRSLERHVICGLLPVDTLHLLPVLQSGLEKKIFRDYTGLEPFSCVCIINGFVNGLAVYLPLTT